MKKPNSSATDLPALDLDVASADGWKQADRETLLGNVARLQRMHANGALGGDLMPEDVHPHLERGSAELYHYFTLTMALNYQRDSYALWRAATSAFNDQAARCVFDPRAVSEMSLDELRVLLVRHRIALQHNKHPEIWRRICISIRDLLGGDIRNLFEETQRRVPDILDFVQQRHKVGFPYLSGPKIANYWLYVMDQYTDASLKEKEALSVAPDTHVMQASVKLGLVPPSVREQADGRLAVSESWKQMLAGTGIAPIDIHTPLWLWSRGGFVALDE